MQIPQLAENVAFHDWPINHPNANLLAGSLQPEIIIPAPEAADFEKSLANGESIESVFSKLESAAAPVIKKLVVSDNAALEGQDRADQMDLGGLLFLMRIARGGTSSFGPHPR